MFYFIFAMFLGILSAAEFAQTTPAEFAQTTPAEFAQTTPAEFAQTTPNQMIRQTRSLPLSIHRQQIAEVKFVADPYENFVSVHILGPCIPVLPDNDNVIYLKNKPHMSDQILSEQTLALRPYYILSCAEHTNHEKLLTFFSCARPLHFLRICLTFVDVLSKTLKEYLLMYPTSVDIVNHYASKLFPNVLMCPIELRYCVDNSKENATVREDKKQEEVPVRKKHRARRYIKK